MPEYVGYIQTIGPYSCAFCSYETMNDSEAVQHFLENHQEEYLQKVIENAKKREKNIEFKPEPCGWNGVCHCPSQTNHSRGCWAYEEI